MSIDKIISEIESQCGPDNFVDGSHKLKAPAVIDLIRKHCEGMVLVPEDVLKYIESELSDCPDKLTKYPPDDKYEPTVVNIKAVVTKLLQASKEGE